MAHRRFHARRSIRRLRRVPVLRGGAARSGWKRGRHRAPQGRGDSAGERVRSRGALRKRPRPGPECAVGAGGGSRGGRTAARTAGSRAPQLGRQIVGASRGGASDASHFAPAIALTVDGLGPRGGGAHTPDEYVLTESLRERAEVALALALAALER